MESYQHQGLVDNTSCLVNSWTIEYDRNFFSLPLLIQACQKCQWAFAKYLVLNGANVESVDFEEKTPLVYACRSLQTDVVKLLIDKGAELSKLSLLSPQDFFCMQLIILPLIHDYESQASKKSLQTAGSLKEIYSTFRRCILSQKIAFLAGELLSIASNSPDIESRCYLNTPFKESCFKMQIESELQFLYKKNTIPQEASILRSSHFFYGACAGMVMDFVMELSTRPFPLTEEDLLCAANRFYYRPGIRALVFQLVYENLFFHFSSYYPLHPDKLVKKRQKDEINLHIRQSMYQAYQIETSPILNEQDQTGDLNYLKTCLKGSNSIYESFIEVGVASHVISLIETSSNTYLFDPSYGLMKFPLENAAEKICQLLQRLYPEISDHHLCISKISYFARKWERVLEADS